MEGGMFPIPARVIFPAAVALLSALWAAAEWLAEYRAAPAGDFEPLDVGELAAQREAADERAERKLRLAEAREARLARRQGVAQADDSAAG